MVMNLINSNINFKSRNIELVKAERILKKIKNDLNK